MGDQGVNWTTPSSNPTGSAPADAYEPADIALPGGVAESDWKLSIGDQQGDGASGAQFVVETGREKKLRFSCEPTLVKIKDNILGKGVKKFGHPHMGFGLVDWDENTTFQTARASPRSTCAGGPLNGSNYMEPAFLAELASGAIVAVLPQDQINYYILGEQGEANYATWLRAGMQFLIGPNPKDMNDTKRRAQYVAGGRSYPGGVNYGSGQLGYYCVRFDGTQASVVGDARMEITPGNYIAGKARYLRGPSGEDPFNGGCYGTEAEPATLAANLLAPGCWDRHNLTAPDGRSHFYYPADPYGAKVCPKTTAGVDYGHVPELEVKNFYLTTGFADYGAWYLESDRMRVATTECPDATAPCDGASGGNVPGTVDGVSYSRVSISPCRSTGLDFCNGETLHADYTFGWKVSIFDTAQRECLGISVRGVAPTDGPAECNTNLLDRYHELRYNTVPEGSMRDWIDRGCTTVSACKNSTPSNPVGRYMTIPGYEPGVVNIHGGH